MPFPKLTSGKYTSEPKRAPATSESQNHVLPLLSLTETGKASSSALRDVNVGVCTSNVVKLHKKRTKPINPMKLKASFHCQT